MLTMQGLMKIRSKAVKRGIWYESLSRTERAIIDLTIKCVEKIRSPTLARSITQIVSKIAQTLQKGFMEKAHEIGSNLSKQIAEIAQKWGNKKSPKWKTDRAFITFLGVTALNT